MSVIGVTACCELSVPLDGKTCREDGAGQVVSGPHPRLERNSRKVTILAAFLRTYGIAAT